MSKDIKVGDWVRIKPGHVGQDNVEFQVTRVVRSVPDSWGNRYAEGDPEGNGIWFRFLEKIDAPTEPKPTSGEIVRSLKPGQKFKVDPNSTIYYVRQEDGWSANYNTKYVYPELSDKFWETFVITVLDNPETSIVEDIAIGVAFEKIVAYRKELIALLDSSAPDARPIVQAKLSAVNEVIARIQA